jgi:hypothetical protein
MSNRVKFMRVVRLPLLAVAFAVSVISVSNLMPLLVQTATNGLNLLSDLLIALNMLVGVVAVTVLAKAMYRLDKKAGRIRNKVRWLE